MVPCSWPHDSSNLATYYNCLVERPGLEHVTLQYTDFPNRNIGEFIEHVHTYGESKHTHTIRCSSKPVAYSPSVSYFCRI